MSTLSLLITTLPSKEVAHGIAQELINLEGGTDGREPVSGMWSFEGCFG